MKAQTTRILGLAVIAIMFLLPLVGGYGVAEEVDEMEPEFVEETYEEILDEKTEGAVEDLAGGMFDGLLPERTSFRDRFWNIFGSIRENTDDIKDEIPDLSRENISNARGNIRENATYVVDYIVSTTPDEKIDAAQEMRGLFHNTSQNFIDGVQEDWEQPGDMLREQKGRFRERLFEAKEKGIAELIDETADIIIEAINTAQSLSAEDVGTGENLESRNEFQEKLYNHMELPMLERWAEAFGDAL